MTASDIRQTRLTRTWSLGAVLFDRLLPAVTEFRPGTYVFNDRTTAEVGACDWDDCALTVLATVVSTAISMAFQ